MIEHLALQQEPSRSKSTCWLLVIGTAVLESIHSSARKND
jgi:hypothetical protein